MIPRLLRARPFLSDTDLAALKAEIAGLTFTPRGSAVTDSSEAWLSPAGSWVDRIDEVVAGYAASHLDGVLTDEKTNVLCTDYVVGKSCPEHTDQYVRGSADTRHRTVSAILVVEAPTKGGEITIKDHDRTVTWPMELQENELLLFPADHWHSVATVTEGASSFDRALVRAIDQGSFPVIREEIRDEPF